MASALCSAGCASSPSVLFRAHSVPLNSLTVDAHRQALPRMFSALRVALSPSLLHGLRGLGFFSDAPVLEMLAGAAHLRMSSASGAPARCVAEFVAAQAHEGALLDHPLRFWVDASVLVTTGGLRARALGGPRVLKAPCRERRLLRPFAPLSGVSAGQCPAQCSHRLVHFAAVPTRGYLGCGREVATARRITCSVPSCPGWQGGTFG